MAQYYLSQTEKKAMQEFKTAILQKLRRKVLAMKIFGSKAKEEAKRIIQTAEDFVKEIETKFKTPQFKL